MKTKIFITIDSLVAAGGEKSLITFLSVLDYNKFDVDLQLFRYGGEFERYVPDAVNLLPPLEYTKFLGKTTLQQLLSFDFKKLFARLRYSIGIRINAPFHMDKARIYWKSISGCLNENKNEYDIAIAYAQGIPTFYVVDKIRAKQKFGWVNVGYKLDKKNKAFQERYYRDLNHIITVSDSAHSIFSTIFPEFKSKMSIIWDMLDAQLIFKMADEHRTVIASQEVPTLLTIARLNKPQKGYDISLEACKELKNRGIKFKWYAIGKGPFKDEMVRFITENNLEDYFILLGTTPNPYPYIKDCTIYVQTSRHEGYGLSIAESRILNKPIVTTEFDAVYNQMVQNKNGIVVKQDPFAVADAIELLLSNQELYQSIIDYQKQEKKGNIEEINKFYDLIAK